MNIRQKLTLRFLLIVSLIFILASVTIFTILANYRKDTFYNRLLDKAQSTAKLLLEVAEINASLLRRIEKDNPTSLPKEKISVYNHLNEIIFTTDEEETLIASSSLLDSIRQKGEIRYVQGEFEIVGYSFKSGQNSYVVIAGAVDIFGKSRLVFLRNILLLVNGLSLILVFISGWIFSGQALAPIKNVVNQVDKITVNRLNLRVDEGNGTDEIARLAQTFNRMLDRLENAFKIQKDFIANASHELRTPLTSITGQLEINLLKERTVEEYKASLQSVLDDMNNLIALSNQMLLLAQTTSETNKANFIRIRVDELLWQVQAEMKKRNQDYKVNIHIDGELTDDYMLTVSGNEQLLKTAFINLADNGCKYSFDHQVWISLKNGDSKNIIISFMNRGIPIKEEDLKQIFEPFKRGKNALPFRGHGIGLSLVDRILKLHNGEITIDSQNSETVFTVSLPTVPQKEFSLS